LSSKIPKYVPPSPYTPFLRRFTDERARDLNDTVALYNEVGYAYRASQWSHEDALERVSSFVVDAVKEVVDLPTNKPIMEAFDRSQKEILALETTIFAFPEIVWPVATLSLSEQVDLRRFLRAKQQFLGNADRVSAQLALALGNVFAGIVGQLASLPETDANTVFTVPLVSLLNDPRDVVDRIIGTISTYELAEAGLFTTLQDRLYKNICAASDIVPYEDTKKRLITAADSELPPMELVQTYLKGTPFLDLFLTPVAFTIPREARFEHCHIVGGIGHGKTQLLQTLMLADCDAEDRPAVVAIDSQGDMIRTLSRLARFDPLIDDRLVILDPADYEWPPRLNIFDMSSERLASMRPGAREQVRAGIIELYDYIFAGLLDAETTQKQSVVFRYLAGLMLNIKDATIQTLRQLLEDPKPFQPYIDALTGTARNFFENEFKDKSFYPTRKQILRRLYGILSNPVFERMFSYPRNGLDMKTALDSGKVVLINTAKDVLKTEASAMFGRYCIALIMQAVLERAAEEQEQRRPALVYIDEAAEYFDQNIDTLLIQARKYRTGITFSHQHLHQLKPEFRASVMTAAAVRFAGGVSDEDARALRSDMRTSAEFLLSMRKRKTESDFACYVRNVTDNAIKLTLPFLRAEREPKMTERSRATLLARNRAATAAPISEAQAHIDASTKPIIKLSDDPEEFADRY
jgi:hypothetical protein